MTENNSLAYRQKKEARQAADLLLDVFAALTPEVFEEMQPYMLGLLEKYVDTAVSLSEKYGAAGDLLKALLSPGTNDEEKRNSLIEFNKIAGDQKTHDVPNYRTVAGKGKKYNEHPRWGEAAAHLTESDDKAEPETPSGLRKRG